MKLKYCEACGRELEEKGRSPRYSENSGKLDDYLVGLECPLYEREGGLYDGAGHTIRNVRIAPNPTKG